MWLKYDWILLHRYQNSAQDSSISHSIQDMSLWSGAEGEVRDTRRWSSVRDGKSQKACAARLVTERPRLRTLTGRTAAAGRLLALHSGLSLSTALLLLPPAAFTHYLCSPHNGTHLNSVFRVGPSWSRQLRHEAAPSERTVRVQMKEEWSEWDSLCLHAA